MAAILLLLKRVPLKDWLYGGAIIALLLAFGWYTAHERGIGADQVKAADARASAAQIIHNREVEDRAKKIADAAVAQYIATLTRPPAADAPHVLVCKRPVATGTVPADAGHSADSHGAADVPVSGSSDPQPVDIGPPIDKKFEDADALVKALQSYVQACVDAKICKAP